MLKDYLVDLHIHIGAGKNGQAVKITASKNLNFENILKESLYNKGLNIVGIIDCASPVVISDMEKLLESGEMHELEDGGIEYGDLLIIPGSEIESREENGGQAHYLAYFPYLKNIKDYSEVMNQYISNINLSSQSTGLTGREILQIVEYHEGVLIPAHVFTPYKSFYGKSFTSYQEVFSDKEWDRIPAIELGLSADTYLADYIDELEDKTFISNSDAHSLIKIAREYNKMRMKSLSFKELMYALKRVNGRGVIKNYGLDPRLGKYHRSFCPDCERNFTLKYPVLECPECGRQGIVVGVKDRILEISDRKVSITPDHRGEYIHQIPLRDIPGIGKRTYQNLLEEFGTEMKVIHQTTAEDLLRVVNKIIRDRIIKARSGNIEIKDGGGGNYGKVMG
ncbi:MAG: endonuclease Q family protein [Halanaerobiales bacterium]